RAYFRGKKSKKSCQSSHLFYAPLPSGSISYHRRANRAVPSSETRLHRARRDVRMRTRKLGVVGAGTMGGGIAALAASAGVPVVLLDVPATEGDPSGTAKKGLERQLKARPPAFMDADRASLIRVG